MARLAVLALLISLATPHGAVAQKTLTIFHINDTHSYVFPWGPKLNGIPQNGAAARLIQRLNELRATAVNPILLHGGDSFTGDLVFNRFLGRAEFQIFDSIGVTAMALGNHDFDIRPFRLKNAIVQSKAKFDFLSANIRYNTDTSGLSQYVKPFVVKTVGAMKVGIFGLTTTTTPSYGESEDVTFESATTAARRMVDSLRARNVDLIVAVTHLGVSEDRQLAQNVSGIDVIVGGHSHTPLTQPVLQANPAGDTTIIVQAGSKWQYLGRLVLTLAGSTKTWTYQLETIGAPMPEDPSFATLMRTYQDSITTTYGNVYTDTVGILTEELPSVNSSGGELESPLVNLVTDAYRFATNADVAFEVASLMRQNLYRGAISTAEVRQTLSWAYDPVQNLGKRLSIVRMDGQMLHFVLNSALSLSFDFFGGGGAGLALQTSGLQYSISGLGFVPVVRTVWVNGEPLENNRIYSVALNEFVADFARRFPLIQFISRTDTTFGADEALKHYLRSLRQFDASVILMGRVWDETRISPPTFAFEQESVLIRWNPNTEAVAYHLYRKSDGTPFVRLNALPLTSTEFRDPTATRGRTYYYQIEEIRSNGLRYRQPPVAYQAGGLPSTTYLRQNFPNPFNASTKIVFGLAEKSRVQLRAFNLLGQRIATLLDDERAQGEYEIIWHGSHDDGTPTSSGVYLLEMRTPSQREVRTVVLVR
jgi:2',3'-cyclic-nucleotide 2'-phosphodiesterase (5'-nucleotidase family)